MITALYTLALALSARPAFAACMALACAAGLVIVSNAKQETLREPLVFTDLSLFSQLFAHPRLYLPFLSAGKVVAISFGVAAFGVVFVVDHPLVGVARPLLLGAMTLSLALGVVLASRVELTLDVSADCARHGFLATFTACLSNGLRPATFRALHAALDTSWYALSSGPDHRPDVIVIQSESFFDARKLDPAIRTSLLAHFDRACKEAVLHGELDVPAWGANTMRSEFALLSGIEEARLGYARFYPYAFVRRATASLATWFGRAGYRTSAIHPYHADFFGRGRAYRHLGFERFVDIESFAHAPHAGAYVADQAVADEIIRTLDASADPAFIFAVTMENHGPLHLESVNPGEDAAFHALGDAPALHELTAYLRHLVHADAMIGRLLAYLRTREREAVVCFYGDHVPAMSRVYRHLGREPRRSDFFIWTSYDAAAHKSRDLRADELGHAVIGAMDGERKTVPKPRPAVARAEMT